MIKAKEHKMEGSITHPIIIQEKVTRAFPNKTINEFRKEKKPKEVDSLDFWKCL